MHIYRTSPLHRLVSCFTFGGRRSRAERWISQLLLELKLSQRGSNPHQFALEALHRLTPRVVLRSRRKGGIAYKVPTLPRRSEEPVAYPFRWLRQETKRRPERQLPDRLCRELKEAHRGRGSAHRHREELHRLALLNRGFIRLFR